MINRETAKEFLEINGYPNPDSNFEKELLDTMVEYAQQQVKNNGDLGDVSGLLPCGDEIWVKAQETSRFNFEEWYDKLFSNNR